MKQLKKVQSSSSERIVVDLRIFYIDLLHCLSSLIFEDIDPLDDKRDSNAEDSLVD